MNTANDHPAVIVGIDGSDSALGGARWAADYAAAQGLSLTLLHVVAKLEFHFAAVDQTDVSDAGADRVLAAAEAAVRAAHPDLHIRTEVVRGGVTAALVDASESARVLVVGSGALDHPALGSHVVRITHRAQCPVLVWRPPAATRTGKPLPVVVGIDESDASTRALKVAFDVVRVLHAQLNVVHMWEIDAAVGMGDLGGQGNMDWQLLDVLQTKQRQRMDELVAPFANKYPNAHVNKVFQDISPAKGLANLSREAQLVVVGSHGRGRFAEALLGSVSQNVIHHAECPVLVVH